MRRAFVILSFVMMAVFSVSTAKSAGNELMLYTSLDVKTIAALTEEFSKIHPEITVKYLKITSSALPNKLILEQRAGIYLADVVISSMDEMYQLTDLFQPYASSQAIYYPKEAKDPDGKWIIASANATGLLYNPKLVEKLRLPLPKTYEELGNPRYKDNLIVEAHAVDIYKALLEFYKKDKGKSITENLLRNAKAYIGQRMVVEMLLVGEAPFALGYTFSVVTRPGAPIAFYEEFRPLILKQSGVFLAKNAPNPKAAKLFIDFLLSHEIQKKVMVDMGRTSRRYDLASQQQFIVPSPVSGAEYKSLLEEWRKFLGD
ncbi:MAG: hypothetical protein A3C07_00800 [Candidatus Sungbacteria bacterium RIFCSPHIGHO2_02_FULL_47_11]|uniref:ABC transporter substrate-binding protein n=1 Tax=Candidatus Sungbacteria bacterium RIFCSPHIGHO2_02_FULL_47_11 TaxID=1802270 RepID=A0A1G2KR93_9BACT|nr:MAG: hypothetical protein A3C07_00800 [Candidatus Sungbacteria bacterium RIFCSPHIGHO2_02_FULL_47_11]